MNSTAEVGAAVALILTGGAGLSSGGVQTALTPNTQLTIATLLILSAGLGRRYKAAGGQSHSTHRKFYWPLSIYVCRTVT